MKKRLVLFGILLCSIFGFFVGCTNDPYKDLQLINLNNESEVQLFVEQTYVSDRMEYTYPTYDLEVEIKNAPKDMSKNILVSGGSELVNYSINYLGLNKSRISITPISYDKTGKFTLVVKTEEGNKSLSINFRVDLKITSFDYKEENLGVMVKGEQLDLTDLDKYITFSPAETSQRDIEFEVVYPISGAIDGRNNVSYKEEDSYGKFAEIKNGILYTYSKDSDGKAINYPKLKTSATIEGETGQDVYVQCIPLKASYKGQKPEGSTLEDKYIDIVVIENCENVSLRMECQKDGDESYVGQRGSFELSKNENGEYDVTLICPHPEAGIWYDDYYTNRTLSFDFVTGGDDSTYYNPNDYMVLLNSDKSGSNIIQNEFVTLSSFGNIDNTFSVSATGAGVYKHKFKIDNKNYPGIINTEVVVNFHVINLPYQIKINNSVDIKQNDKSELNVFTVFKNYGGARGTKFEVKLNNSSDYKYFVYAKDDELIDNLTMYKVDGSTQIFGKCDFDDSTGKFTIKSSSKSNFDYSTFRNGESFYLRHSYEILPEEQKQLYIGIMYNVASDSYSDEVKERYFVNNFIEFPINLDFEVGVENITFTENKYLLDVTNPNYNNDIEDDGGVLLFELSQGQSLDSVLDMNDLTYDKDLIKVYAYFNDSENKTYIYMKANNTYKTGTTTLFVRTKNGIQNSVNITTFIPTIYAENEMITDETEKMPLSVNFDSDDVLYYFTGKSIRFDADRGIDVVDDPHAKYNLYKNGTQIGWDYLSLNKLFMINGTSLDLKFYDYLVVENDGEMNVTPIDITNNIDVKFNFDGFASFSGGRLSVFRVTEDKTNPLIMTISYTGGYVKDVDGKQTYVSYPVTLKVELYIYLPLQGVKVTSPKNVDIYIDDSLGVMDKAKNLSTHTIESDYVPNEIKLGADWNNDETYFDSKNPPVNLYYDIKDILNSPVIIDGKELVLYSKEGIPMVIHDINGDRGLVYGDLFEIITTSNKYNCMLKAVISEKFKNWIVSPTGGNYNNDEYYWFLKNRVFNSNISMSVNVYISQFMKLQNINSIRFNVKYTSKVSSLDLDIADDGVYFEKRESQETKSITIGYSIGNPLAINKDIMLLNSINSVFEARVNVGTTSVNGTITITPKNAGIEYLTVVPMDNIKSYDESTGTYEYYDQRLVQKFRVKVADGSIMMPFEIRTVDDFVMMQDDLRNGKYFNYVLARNINLSKVDTIVDINGTGFSLDGKYSYSRNGIEYENVYSLTHLNIKKTIENPSGDTNIGLFGSINNATIIRNLNIINANIDITIKSLNGHALNVGILSGKVGGLNLYNSFVEGQITIKNLDTTQNSSSVNIGGVIGLVESYSNVVGLPASYIAGYSNSPYNSNVRIDYTQANSNYTNHNFSVGGFVGNAQGIFDMRSLNIVSSIYGINYKSSVGSVAGTLLAGTLESVVVYPNIVISDVLSDKDSELNISTMIGSGDCSVVNSKVYFTKDNIISWQNALKVKVVVQNPVNFGALIGKVLSETSIKYTYVRSFYNENTPSFQADIYISSTKSSKIGGLVGSVDGQKLVLENSYFNANILTNGTNETEISTNNKIGLLLADTNVASGSSISNSYAIANLKVICENKNIYTLSKINDNFGLIVTSYPNDVSKILDTIEVDALDSKQSNEISNLTIQNIYGIINSNTYFFGNNSKITAIYDESKPFISATNGNGIVSGSYESVFEIFNDLGYNIIKDSNSEDANNSSLCWILNKNVNKVNNIGFPVLLSKETPKVAMYDLIPTKIYLDNINVISGLYNISTTDKTQLIMILNKVDKNSKAKDYFDIEVDSDSSAISIKFNGETILTKFFRINSDLEFSENSNEQIISIQGNKVYPVNEGLAVLTINSVLDKTVKLEITIKVVCGVTELQFKNVVTGEQFEDKDDSPKPIVYIDEVSYFEILNKNIFDKNSSKETEYLSSREYGYKITVLESETLIGSLTIGGKTLGNVGDEIIVSSSSLVVKGVSIGTIKLQIIPIIFIDELAYDENNYFDKLGVSKQITIIVNARAKSIDLSKDSIKIAPKNTSNFKVFVQTSNVVIDTITNKVKFLSALNIKINSKAFVIDLTDREYSYIIENDTYVIQGFDFEVNFELIRFKFNSLVVSKTDGLDLGEYTYDVVFGVIVKFDSNYYRTHANDFDLNTIEYSFVFSPKSNESLTSVISIGVSPNELNSIFTNYYARGELLADESEKYANENESRFVLPGTSGLLKITLDEEFNDSSYIIVTLDNKYIDYVELGQMAGSVDNVTLDSTNDLTDYITKYTNISYKQYISTSEEYGIRLSKMTLNYNDENYFNKTYFVKLTLNRNYGDLENIVLNITSYKVGNGSVERAKSISVTYGITELPYIDVKVDGSQSAVLGRGIKKELEIKSRGISSEISVGSLPDNVFICDDQGININNTLSVDYLNQNRKYYLCAKLDAKITNAIIEFNAEEIILGVREHTKASIAIQTVIFEIEDVKLEGSIDGVVTIKHGQTFALNTEVSYKVPTVGTEKEIKEFVDNLTLNNVGDLNIVEYSIAGASVTKQSFKGSKVVSENEISKGTLRLYNPIYVDGDRVFKPITKDSTESLKVYDYIELDENTYGIKVSNRDDEYDEYTIKYYSLKGISITGDYEVNLRITIPYYYDTNGKLVIDTKSSNNSANAEKMTYYEFEPIDFKLVVEDSSTYDHPNPIETQDDLFKACSTGTGDYILLNNLVLKDWVPQDVNFRSLDGNGYTIKVESYNLSSIRGGNSVNVGIFATTSEDTLLKNITVDVSNMLVTETQMLKDVETLRNASSTSYDYDGNINIAFTNTVNFGVLVGTNNGAITNAKIVSTFKNTEINNSTPLYLHIITTLGYIDSTFVNTNIGGIVGVNSSTGAITNSFVGLSLANMTGSSAKIQLIKNASDSVYNNVRDSLEDVEIYPFILAGGNKLGGIVSENSGIVSNTYAKGLGLYNTYPAVKDSQTAGLVATNNGTITSSFVESAKIGTDLRAIKDEFIIESTGNVGGLVFNNNGLVENSYSNAYLETQSAFTGGFVFSNNENGQINNAYSTAVNKYSLAHGQFTGVDNDGRSILNAGTYNNCYYLVLNGEKANELEDATAIVLNLQEDSDKEKISDKNTWRGFSFASKNNAEAIWTFEKTGETPKIGASLIDTTSFRQLTEVEEKVENGNTITVYNYEYKTNTLGSLNNPLIIDKAENFDKYIIDNSFKLSGDDRFVFGAAVSSGNALSNLNVVRHVRVVNNLDFEQITTAQMYKGTYLYKTVFAGVLDGNGMTFKNLNINTDDVQLENFGLFAQVGISSKTSTLQTVVKNLNLSLRTYKSSDSSRAGVLAGTIVNSNIINVKIDGGNTGDTQVIIGARNMAGALAGLIYSDNNGENKVSLFDIDISNVAVESSYGSLGGEITNDSKDVSGGFYNKFSIKNVETNETVEKAFNSLYNNESKKTILTVSVNGKSVIKSNVSYAGTVAGVIIANNYSKQVQKDKDVSQANEYNDYKTNPDDSTIDNVVASGIITIRTADNAGGLFGYVGENTLIKNSHFVLSDNQIIRAFNYAGGLVAENHGVIEQCSVAFSDNLQLVNDRNILSTNRNNASQLFDTMSSTDYTVAIGGLVGYSSNGVIIDSVNKVNAIKPYAYIAGGLVGYSENYNYIGYSFSTGAVYSKFITGGLVGLQVNKNTDLSNTDLSQNLTLKHAYALTDWNLSRDSLDIRQNITNRLYENQKVLYKMSDGSYYNFYVKMPEIGNLDINVPVEMKVSKADYENSHNEYYVGSAIGYAIINTADTGYNRAGTSKLISNLEDYNYGASSNVVTNTLGLYSSTGSLANGNKVDDYFKSTFSYVAGTDSNINMYSYKVAYKDSNLNKYTLNNYLIDEQYIEDSEGNTYVVSNDSVKVGATTYPVEDGKVTIGEIEYLVKTRTVGKAQSGYYDVFDYSKVFVQEYLEQILGTYSRMIDDGTTNKATASVFKYPYSDDTEFARFLTNKSGESFVHEGNGYIWAMDTYLPKFSKGLYVSVQSIENTADLNNAFTTLSTGRIYNVKPASGGKIEVDITALNKYINYTQTIKDTFIGGKVGEINPKIVFKLNADQMSGNSTKVNSIFNILSGVTFSNIDFEFKFNNFNFSSPKDYANFGLIANTIQNSDFTDCSFTLNLSQSLTFEGSAFNYNSSTVGLMFGSIINTSFNNCKFELNANNNSVTLNNTLIENFGLVAGTVYSSNIQNSELTIKNINTITISNSANSLNVGGIAGVFNSSRLTPSKLSICDISIVNKSDFATLNISQMMAYASNSILSDINITTILTFKNSDSVQKIEELSISKVVGMSYANKINGTLSGEIAVSSTTDVSKISKLSVGGFVGFDQRNTTLGLDKAIVTTNISVSAFSNNLSVGGLIGKSAGSSNLISTGEFGGKINTTNNCSGSRNGDNVTYAYTNVGGLVGQTTSSVKLSNVMNVGKTEVTTKDDTAQSIVSIGGIAGRTESRFEINNFASFAEMTTQNYSNAVVYVSGVVGYNGGVFAGVNGFTLVELPNSTGIVTSAITNNSVSDVTKDVFYASELMGNSYESDAKYNSYALADIYFDDTNSIEISKYSYIYSRLYSRLADCDMKLVSAGKLKVLIPNGMTLTVNTLNADGTTKNLFEPNVVGDSNDLAKNGYMMLLSDIQISGKTLSTTQILSGRTTKDGKVKITKTNNPSSSDTEFAFESNNGIISNVYFETSTHEGSLAVAQNVAFVNKNEGIIKGVYAYGLSSSKYSIAKTNSGSIVQSGSYVVYYPTDNTSTSYGLVDTNSGLISDCYSMNSIYTKSNSSENSVYGLAKQNSGTIQYSYYDIPELMTYNNNYAGIVKENIKVSGATIYRCESNSNPSFARQRKTIWTEENNHSQLIGVKDIKGAITIEISVVDGATSTSYKTVSALKEAINSHTDEKDVSDAIRFDYELKFFDMNPAEYNAIRFKEGYVFTNYINSLTTSYIPENTILLIDGNIFVNSELKAFSIPSSSMILGLRAIDGVRKIANIIYNNTTSLGHEIINTNNGIIAGVNFENFNLQNQSGMRVFAPIISNYGIIYKVSFQNKHASKNRGIYVDGKSAKYVSAICVYNRLDAIISNCHTENISLYSGDKVNFICNFNYGTCKHNESDKGNGVVSGNPNSNGVDYGLDEI